MGKPTPSEEPNRRPSWDEVQRLQRQWREIREARRAQLTQDLARCAASLELVKREEAMAARRRCWLF